MHPLPPTPTASFTLPPPLAHLLAQLPAYPGSVLLAQALNLGLADQLPKDVCGLLQGKKFRIHVLDARLLFDFAWEGRRFVAGRPEQLPDLSLRANAHDFLRMARRQADPDTLFFSRRLVMEGDTELGLIVKNTLDALEFAVLDRRHWSIAGALQRLSATGPANSVATPSRKRRPTGGFHG